MGISTGERVTKLQTALDTFSHSVEKRLKFDIFFMCHSKKKVDKRDLARAAIS